MDVCALGARIRQQRLAAGMTQLHVAIALKVARSTLSGIENGRRAVSEKELVALAQVFKVKTTDLLPGECSRS